MLRKYLHATRGARATIAYLSLTFLVPTLAFVIIKHLLGFQGPSLNADFLLLAILCAVGARHYPKLSLLILVVGIFFVMLIHVGIGVGAIYIDDIALIRDYFQFVRYWPWREIFYWGGIGAAAMAVLYVALLRIEHQKVNVVSITLLLAALIVVDLVADTRIGHRFISNNVLTSSANRARQLVQRWRTNPGFSMTPVAEAMMAHEVSGMERVPDRILSVSVEAYGLAHDDDFNRTIIGPLTEIVSPRYSVRILTHAGRGGTLTGELRELCNVKTTGTPTVSDREKIAPGCLPQILREQGVRTLGIHGNSGFFYNRREVYPAIGFEKTLFYDDFLRNDPGAARCKTRAFQGICDDVAFRAALSFLAEGDRRFAHVMTLDTHFPLDPVVPEDRKCRVPGLENEDLCIYANRMRSILEDLAKLLATADSPPDVVFLYGDHPPPYATKTERAWFHRDAVPFVVLTRKP